MLRYAFALEEEAVIIERAIQSAREEGVVTADLSDGHSNYSTSDVGQFITEQIGVRRNDKMS